MEREGHAVGDRLSTMSALAAAILLLGAFSIFAAHGGGRTGAGDLSAELYLVMTASTAALTFLLGGLLFGLAPQESNSAGAWLGLGMMLLAALSVGVGEIGPALVPGADQLETVRGWGLLAVFVAFTRGLCTGSGEERVGPIPCVAAGLAAGAIAVHQLAFDGVVVFELAWGIMVLAQAAAYLSTHSSRHIWVGITLAGFLLSEIGVADARLNEGWWVIGVPTLRILALLAAVVGLLVDLRSTVRARSRALETSRAHVLSLQDATAAVRRAHEERDHEARAALAAIEFTAHTMRRANDLDAAALRQLEQALTTELALLRRLITMPDLSRPARPFSVAETMSGVVAYANASGMQVEAAIAHDLVAFGSDEATAAICQNLLENARRHAPGSPVVITGRPLGENVLVRFDDAGPGIPPERREQVFRRGGDGDHPSSAEGRGLGLYIARQLTREQGGTLWVDDSEAGGASFRLLLPGNGVQADAKARQAEETHS